MAEDEMVGRHHQFDGHEFEQTPGDGEGLGSLPCSSPWGHRVRHDLEMVPLPSPKQIALSSNLNEEKVSRTSPVRLGGNHLWGNG